MLALNACFRVLAFLAVGGSLLVSTTGAPLELLPEAKVDAQGIFLNQILKKPKENGFSNILLAPAPEWGKADTLSQEKIGQLLAKVAPHLANRPLVGAETVRVEREARLLNETELLLLLKEKLQPQNESGQLDNTSELELKLTREWNALPVPAGSTELRILDMPSSGLSSHMLVRFELRSEEEVVGIFPAFLKVQLWRDVWVARSTIRRNTVLSEANLVQERRDVLGMREPCWQGEQLDSSHHITEGVGAGAILYARAVQPRPIVRRNDVVQAIAQVDFLTVAIRAQALEDGALGQIIRARNVQSKKEILGKVLNAHTISVSF